MDNFVYYNCADWYWLVGGDTSRMWSSARMTFVPATAPPYQAWIQAGKSATQIGSLSELFSVLIETCFPIASAAGITVYCQSDDALSGQYSIDAKSLQDISSISTGIAAGKPLPGGGDTFAYPIGSNHRFTGPVFLDFAAAIESFVWAYQQAVSDRLNGTATALPSSILTIA